jgi:hypothetical protein
MTVRPPFDPQEFARQTESRVRVPESSLSSHLTSTLPPPAELPQYPHDLADPDHGPFGPDTIPMLAMDPGEFAWFELPPLAHRLLAYVNGQDSVARICELTGTDLGDALATLADLAREGVISAESGTRG